MFLGPDFAVSRGFFIKVPIGTHLYEENAENCENNDAAAPEITIEDAAKKMALRRQLQVV